MMFNWSVHERDRRVALALKWQSICENENLRETKGCDNCCYRLDCTSPDCGCDECSPDV